MINRLLVSNVNLYLRDNTGASEWVDFSGARFAAAARVDSLGDVVRYDRNGADVLSAEARVQGSPFTIVAETPRSGAMARWTLPSC